MHAVYFLHALLSSADFFSKSTYWKTSFRNKIRVSKGLDLGPGYQHSTAILVSDTLHYNTVKPVVSGHSKNTKIGFQDRLSLNEGRKYCRMLSSAIPLTCIKLPFVVKTLSCLSLSGRFRQVFCIPNILRTVYCKPLSYCRLIYKKKLCL